MKKKFFFAGNSLGGREKSLKVDFEKKKKIFAGNWLGGRDKSSKVDFEKKIFFASLW